MRCDPLERFSWALSRRVTRPNVGQGFVPRFPPTGCNTIEDPRVGAQTGEARGGQMAPQAYIRASSTVVALTDQFDSAAGRQSIPLHFVCTKRGLVPCRPPDAARINHPENRCSRRRGAVVWAAMAR